MKNKHLKFRFTTVALRTQRGIDIFASIGTCPAVPGVGRRVYRQTKISLCHCGENSVLDKHDLGRKMIQNYVGRKCHGRNLCWRRRDDF